MCMCACVRSTPRHDRSAPRSCVCTCSELEKKFHAMKDDLITRLQNACGQRDEARAQVGTGWVHDGQQGEVKNRERQGTGMYGCVNRRQDEALTQVCPWLMITWHPAHDHLASSS